MTRDLNKVDLEMWWLKSKTLGCSLCADGHLRNFRMSCMIAMQLEYSTVLCVVPVTQPIQPLWRQRVHMCNVILGGSNIVGSIAWPIHFDCGFNFRGRELHGARPCRRSEC